MKFFTQFSPASVSGTDFSASPTLTQSQFADKCDIKYILARLQSGDLSVLKSTGLYYADISRLPADLQSMMNGVIYARSAWDSRDDLQRRFGTPENMLDFLSDENNRVEAVKLGLINAPVVEQPVKVEVTNPKLVTPEGQATA